MNKPNNKLKRIVYSFEGTTKTPIPRTSKRRSKGFKTRYEQDKKNTYWGRVMYPMILILLLFSSQSYSQSKYLGQTKVEIYNELKANSEKFKTISDSEIISNLKSDGFVWSFYFEMDTVTNCIVCTIAMTYIRKWELYYYTDWLKDEGFKNVGNYRFEKSIESGKEVVVWIKEFGPETLVVSTYAKGMVNYQY